MKKLAIRREHRINETRAESAIKDYVDHVADIAKFPDGTGVPPTSTHPLETPCPPASTPGPLPGWHPTYVPHYHGFASCWGCSQSAARKTAKPTHPALGASPRETGAVFDRTAANLRHGKGGTQRVVPITDTVDDDEIRTAMTAAVAG